MDAASKNRAMTTSFRLVTATAAVVAFGFAAPGTFAQTGAVAGAGAGPVLYTGARLITGNSEPAIEGRRVASRERAHRRHRTCARRQGAEGRLVVTLAGKTVIPALIDTHTSTTRESVHG